MNWLTPFLALGRLMMKRNFSGIALSDVINLASAACPQHEGKINLAQHIKVSQTEEPINVR